MSYPTHTLNRKGRWSFPMFLHVIWEMSGRHGHFVKFKERYEKQLKEIWRIENEKK